jgi:WD40 repeat protein
MRNYLSIALFFMGLWSTISYASRPEISVHLGHSDKVYAVAFSPNAQTILSASADNTLKLWDIETGFVIRTFYGHSDAIYAIAFSPNGQMAVSGGLDKTLILWDIKTGHLIRRFDGHSAAILAIAFAHDGQKILSGSEDKQLKLWNIQTGALIQTFYGHRLGVSAVAFLADGQFALSGSQDFMLKLWNLNTGREIRTFKGHTAEVLAVAISADGQMALSASADKTLKLWHKNTGQLIHSFEGHTDSVLTIALSFDNKTILSGSQDKTVKLWDLTHIDQANISGKPFPKARKWWDFTSIYSDTPKSEATLIDKPAIKTFSGHSQAVSQVAFSADGKMALSASLDYTMKLWDLESGRIHKSYQGHSFSGPAVAISPDGQHALSGSFGNLLSLWDRETGQLIKQFQGHTGAVFAVAFSPDGQTVLSGSFDQTLKLWDVDSGMEIRTFKGHSDQVWAVAVSPDNHKLLSASLDKTVKLWHKKTGKLVKTLTGHSGPVFAVAFSPDGKMVLSGSRDKTLKLWHLDSGQVIQTFVGHTGSVLTVAFSPDGKTILSGSADNTIKLWDISSAPPLSPPNGGKPGSGELPLKKGARTFKGHTGTVWHVAFSPDGKTALSGSADKTLKLWDLKTGRELKTLNNQAGKVFSVTFFPDGKTALSGSFNSTHLWNLETGQKIAQMVAFEDGEWVTITPQDYYVASPLGENYINLSIGHQIKPIKPYRTQFNQPGFVKAILQSKGVDTQPPAIVLEPVKNEILLKNTTSYQIRGQVTDAHSNIAAMTVNGLPIAIDKQGYFSLEGQLEGKLKTRFQMTATDIFNNRIQQNVTLVRQIHCPADIQPTTFTPTQDISRQEIYTMYRLNVKVAFEGERQATRVPIDINPSCLKQAEFLDLSHLDLLELPVWLNQFPNLRKLDISYNQLTNEKLNALTALSVLEALDISHNPLFESVPYWKFWHQSSSQLSIWHQFTQLRELNLSNTNGSTENYGDLSSLTNLHILNLSHNHLKTLTALKLSELKTLRQLNLSHNQLKSLDFSELGTVWSYLQKLEISNNQLGHITFAPLPRLSQLDLHYNNNVSFDPEFGDPFKLQPLCSMTVDKKANLPKGLQEKLKRCQQIINY